MSFLIALFLVLLVFPNVIFRGASLSMLDMANTTGKIRQLNSAHPERPYDLPQYGFSDTGGAAFQSEPMQQFMKFVIYHRQSPYWNPYVAGGALGPETLVDNKFSPFTLLVALLGGSAIAFHLILLSLYVLSIYFLIRLITVHFKLSFLSATTAAIVYLLNGYNVANLASNVSQVYLYFPILLFTLCSFAQKPNYWRYLVLIFANVLILSTTFLPTLALTIISVYLIGFGFVLNTYPVWKNRLGLMGWQALSALIAFLLLAFLWFPLLEGAKTLKLFEMYNARVFYPADLRAFLSFFTPKHFWESYNATPVNVLRYVGNVIFHFGIVASLIFAYVFSQKKNFKNWVIIILLILFFLFLGRIFAIPGLYQLYGVIPQIKNIGEQYLWLVVAISFTLLSAFGMESLTAQKRFQIPVRMTYAIIFGSILYLIFKFIPRFDYYYENFVFSAIFLIIEFYLGIVFLLIISSALILRLISKYPAKLLLFKSFLVGLVFLELFYYMNTLRYKREDIFQSPPSYISFLKENIGHNRLASYSWGLMPDLGAAYQIQQIESLNYVLPWYQKFYERNFLNKTDRWGDFSLAFGQKDEPNINEQMLDMLSVKYILTDTTQNKYKDYFAERNYPLAFQDGQHYIFENVNSFSRVITLPALKKAELTPDTQGYPLDKMAFTEDDKLYKQAQKVGIPSESDPLKTNLNQTELVSYKNAKIIIHAKLQEPAIIAMMDNWHPNWQAYANGREVYVGKINESFRGIALPAGEYKIEFKYQPKTLPAALWISGFLFFILIGLFFFRRRFDQYLSNFIKPKMIQKSFSENLKEVSFCVVVPMYSEEKNAQKCVQTIHNFLKKTKYKTAIIVVNDGSQDKTLVVLNKLSKKMKSLIVISHPRNRGYGAANITGAKAALKNGFEYALFMDADLTQNVNYILPFIEEMKKGTDYIKATRYADGGGVKGVPWKRRTVSRIGNLLAKAFFRLPLTDYTNGFRAVKTKILAKISCRERGFSYLIEEVWQVSKITQSFAEVPYILTVRADKFSKSKFNYSPRVYYNYLKYLFKR